LRQNATRARGRQRANGDGRQRQGRRQHNGDGIGKRRRRIPQPAGTGEAVENQRMQLDTDIIVTLH
jgi:hypothetical protein